MNNIPWRYDASKVLTIFLCLLFVMEGFFVPEARPQDTVPAAPVAAVDKMSLDIKGMDIVDVLKMLASKTALNLVIDKNVAGRVTVFLKDVAPREALQVILSSSGLVVRQEGVISRVMTAQDYEKIHGYDFDDPRQTLRLRLKYAAPKDVAAVLNEVKSKVGRIVVDEVSGTVVLFDTQKKNEEMKKMAEDMDLPLETQTFVLNYARCEKVAETLQPVLSKSVGRIVIDGRSNKIIVTDHATKAEKIKNLVASLDDRTREVLIDAKIVQVNLNDKRSLGIDWEYVLNKKFSVAGMFGGVITTTGNKWTIGKLNPVDANDYRVLIEALETEGETQILSSPRLTVVNNESAKILVGSKQVYVTTTAVQSQATTETAEAVNFVDVGVKLYVTPTIGADGFISLKVQPEVSSVVQNYKTAAGNTIPIVETSQTETTVLLRDGATLVIGGLIKDEKTKTTNKIPVLGNIPFLGFFFRNTVDEVKKTELAIFLTCRILDFESSKKDLAN